MIKTTLALLPLLLGVAQDKGRAAVAAWDTGQASRAPLAPGDLETKAGWTAVPQGQTGPFKGDAVVTNGRLVAVARQGSDGIDVHSGKALRARLVLEGPDGAAARLVRVALAEYGKGSVTLEAAYQTAQGTPLAAKFRLKRGDLAVETEPGPGAARLRVECPSRFLALPDFFADDILIDARKIPLAATEVPSENFLLHLAGAGEALVVSVFENRDQDVRITLEGEGEARSIAASRIDFGKGRKVWTAVVERPEIWHAAEVKDSDAKKVTPLEWRMPFPAQWRVDFTRTDELTDSWEMILQKEMGGEFHRHEWFDDWARKFPSDRKRWTTVLGSFPYPCWVEHDRRGYFQPLRHKALTFRGPAVLYPLNRVKETPPDAYTVVDVVRNTLGMGPCEYILDLEGQKEQYKGTNTCSVRDLFNDLYAKGRQKEKRKEVEKALKDALIFVTNIRERIEQYLEFARSFREHLARQEAGPGVEPFLGELRKMIDEVDARLAARREKIRTPAYVAELNDDFRKNVMDYEGGDALARCKKYTAALVEVGDNQDELVGELRWVVKTLRQRAGIAMALDPRLAPVAEEVRTLTQKILRNPNALERARH